MYVLRYEVFDDMVTFPDVAENRPGRTMWPSKSPIALFAVNKEKRLKPAAIQTDYKPGWVILLLVLPYIRYIGTCRCEGKGF